MEQLNLDRSENIKVFESHRDSVLCCSIDPSLQLAVTGGVDDTAFVWDINTLRVIFECSDHKESVVAVGFNKNSTCVATGDLGGYMQVRNTKSGNKTFEYEVDEINWIKWHPSSDFILLAGTATGDCWLWDVNDPANVKMFPSHGPSSAAGKIFHDGMRFISGYTDGSIKVFNMKTKSCLLNVTDPKQAEIIWLDLNPSNTLVATCSISTSVRIITVSSGKLIASFPCITPPDSLARAQVGMELTTNRVEGESSVQMEDNEQPLVLIPGVSVTTAAKAEEEEEDEVVPDDPIEVEERPVTELIPDPYSEDSESDSGGIDINFPIESVETVAFTKCGNYVGAANNYGSIFIWDVSANAMRAEIHPGVGITRAVWTTRNNYITACFDGTIRIYDLNLNKVNELQLHYDQVLDIAYRDGRLITVSEDKLSTAVELEE